MISDKNHKVRVNRFAVGPLGTNCYIFEEISSSKAVIIDPGFFDRSITEHVKKNNITVKYIVNTHGHADHIMGNAKLGYPVLIHEDDLACLSNPMLNLCFLAGMKNERSAAERALADGDKIALDEVELTVIHTPGHTPGGICLLYDGILFSGDTLFNGGVGRTDCPGGDTDKLIRSIKNKLMVLDDDVRVFPGHGPETTIGQERENNPFF